MPSDAHRIWRDFLLNPFRLFFLTGAIAAIAAALCWLLAVRGWWPVAIDVLNLHAFLFLQGLGGAVYVGFVLTALPEWTHYARPLHRHSQRLWSAWLLAVLIAPWQLSFALAVMGLFWLYLTSVAAHIVLWAKDTRQISVLLLLGMMNLVTWLAVSRPGSFWWQQMLHVNMIGIALITFRIGRVLGQEALDTAGWTDSRFIPNPFYKNIAVWMVYLLVGSNLWLGDSVLAGWLSLAVASAFIGRLREWHFAVLQRQPYVRWYYLTMAIIGIGYGWRGVVLVLAHDNPVLPLHFIAIGGMVLMIYQVMTIAGIRHSGLALYYPLTNRIALLCIVLAALIRSLGQALYPAHYQLMSIDLPGVLLSLAFAIYLPVFYTIFIHHKAVAVGGAE